MANLTPASAAKRAQQLVRLKPQDSTLEPSVYKPDAGLGNDLDISSLNLALYGSASMPLIQSITDATLRRTIEGASTIDVEVNDHDRRILRSGRLVAYNDIKIDGLWFRLCAVKKSGEDLTLTFEDREVAILREYQSVIKVGWGVSTRAQFVKRLLDEPRELKIAYQIEGLTSVTPPASKKDLSTDKTKDKGKGVPASWSGVTVKGHNATPEQISNINAVLDAGSARLAKRKVLVMTVMAITQESSAINLVGGDRDSTGLFQQRASMGWPASRDPVRDANAFLDKAIPVEAQNPGRSPGWLVSQVQRDYTFGTSTQGKDYDQWADEADHTVTVYGISGDDVANDAAASAANGSLGQLPLAGGGANQYEFTRGSSTVENGVVKWVPEDSWTCLQRLANEVGFRCFCAGGIVYFVSEETLFTAMPGITVQEHMEGVDDIDGQYDIGKHDAQVTVAARTGRWVIPPGSTVAIAQHGPFTGRWLVTDIVRSIFDAAAEITLKKPRPVLPEPKQSSSATGNVDWAAKLGPDKTNPNQVPVDASGQGGQFPVGTSLVQPVPDPWNTGHGARHETAGLAGYPASDFFGPPGSPVIACETGTIERFSGHDPILGPIDGPHGPLGWSIYMRGKQSGTDYYYTHLQERTVSVGQVVAGGQQIGTIANYDQYGTPSHTHMGVSGGSVTIEMVMAAPVVSK